MVNKCKLEHKENNVITVTNNNVKYYENLAKQHSDESKKFAEKADVHAKEAIDFMNCHKSDNENPHNVTSEQVGAYSTSEIDNLLDEKLAKKNPNLVAGSNVSIVDNDDGTQTISSENTVLSDYNLFENKPSINNVSLSGNKNSHDLGLASLSDLPINVSELQNDCGYLTGHQSLAGYATEQWVNNRGYLISNENNFIDTGNTLNTVTAPVGDNSTKVATTAFVQNIVGNIENLLSEV